MYFSDDQALKPISSLYEPRSCSYPSIKHIITKDSLY